MKWFSLLFSLTVVTSTTWAQCGMTAQITAFDAQCGGFTISYAIDGGTPPYQVLAYNINGNIIDVNTSATTGTQSYPGTSWGVLLEVTDAEGCVANDEADPAPALYTHPTPAIEWSTNCVTGITTLRMTVSTFPGICDRTELTYELTRTVDGVPTIFTGNFADDWIEESPETYRFDQPLTTGSYFLQIIPTELVCSDGANSWVECWAIWPGSESYASSFFAINAGDCGVNAYVRAALGAVLTNGLMRDDLRMAGLVPTVEPYSDLGYAYIGSGAGTSIPPAALLVTGSTAIVDWVVLEVRSNTPPFPIVRSKPALLLRNGEVRESDGDRYVNFGVLPTGLKRLAIRHRNHLGVMTASSVILQEQPMPNPIDFRSGSAYGTYARVQVNGTWCLWPGDANFDGAVKYSGGNNDRDVVLQAIGGVNPNNTVTGYLGADINLDGVVRYTGVNNDRDIILQTIGGVVPTATRLQQLP
jgi:hypothetical protein